MSKWILNCAVASLLALNVCPAAAATFSLDGGSNFSFSSDVTTVAGVGTATGTLNTSAAPGGFGNFFASSDFGGASNTYGRLGALNSATATNAANSQGSSTAAALVPISFTASELSGSVQIDVSFSYAFAGSNATIGRDAVTVSLFDATGVNPTVFVGQILFSGASQVQGAAFSITEAELFVANVDYTLFFQLAEAPGAGNTAFGFDRISVQTIEVSEPPLWPGMLALGAVFGFERWLRRPLPR